MNIEITEQEKEELKKRVLENAERRLTDELVTSMQRQVTREVLDSVRKRAFVQLHELVAGRITEEMILKEIQRTLSDMAGRERWNEASLHKVIEKAISTFVDINAAMLVAGTKDMILRMLELHLRADKEKPGP
jgi:hypothetical protein